MISVALDARRLQDRPLTGVGRWLTNLLPHLAEQADVVLLTDAHQPAPAGNCECVRLSVPVGLPSLFWLQIAAARWLRDFSGVFHGTFNALPLAYKGPSVVTFHDLSWEHHPEDFPRPKRRAWQAQSRWSARRAGAVTTHTRLTQQSITATYGIAPDRIFLVPPAVDPMFSPEQTAHLPPILDRLGITRPYVVALGGAKRRALDVSVAAWRRLPATAGRPQLVVVGFEAPPAEPGIIHAGRLDDHEWTALLAGAAVFCYPTRFEGYGMPAMEAAASGVPVVCARIGSLPELLDTAAEWCTTPTAAEIGRGLGRVLTDDTRHRELRAAGLARVAQAPTWADSAAVLLDAYQATCP